MLPAQAVVREGSQCFSVLLLSWPTRGSLHTGQGQSHLAKAGHDTDTVWPKRIRLGQGWPLIRLTAGQLELRVGEVVLVKVQKILLISTSQEVQGPQVARGQCGGTHRQDGLHERGRHPCHDSAHSVLAPIPRLAFARAKMSAKIENWPCPSSLHVSIVRI
jgi:hypothetical protein